MADFVILRQIKHRMNQKFTPVYCLIVAFVLIFGSASAQIVKEDTLSNWKKGFQSRAQPEPGLPFFQLEGGWCQFLRFYGPDELQSQLQKGNTSQDNEIDMSGMVNNQGQGYPQDP